MDIPDTQQDIRKGRFLREQVYKRLKASVLEGILPSSKRLIEEKLAAEMGTSRTPVREAIQKLEKEGLIHKLPKGGFAVGVITDEDIEEVFGIRSVLEGYAAALATQRMAREEMDALEDIVRRQEVCLRNNDVDTLIQLNTEFHEVLYKGAKSAKLLSIINDLRDYIYRYRIIILRHEGLADVSMQDHKDMISAMQQKNAKLVEKLVRKHIVRGKDLVKRKLRQDSKRKTRKE